MELDAEQIFEQMVMQKMQELDKELEKIKLTALERWLNKQKSK